MIVERPPDTLFLLLRPFVALLDSPPNPLITDNLPIFLPYWREAAEKLFAKQALMQKHCEAGCCIVRNTYKSEMQTLKSIHFRLFWIFMSLALSVLFLRNCPRQCLTMMPLHQAWIFTWWKNQSQEELVRAFEAIIDRRAFWFQI